jgi:CTP synthase (UTP-ammonia lyase)
MATIVPRPPRIALVGDRSAAVEAHNRIPVLMQALSGAEEPIELYWLHSTSIASPEDVAGFDGIWVVPGSPYASSAGVLAAIETARTGRIPLLGTCGGFQHLLLEFAHNVCRLPDAAHAEVDPDAPELLLVPLRCSLFGEEATVTIANGTSHPTIPISVPSTTRATTPSGPRAKSSGCRSTATPAPGSPTTGSTRSARCCG